MKKKKNFYFPKENVYVFQIQLRKWNLNFYTFRYDNLDEKKTNHGCMVMLIRKSIFLLKVLQKDAIWVIF